MARRGRYASAVPAEPRPSSTVILLREEAAGAGPFSVLMLERHGNIAFPGAHAFPGGLLDPADSDAPGAELPAEQRWAAPDEGDAPPQALPYWVAAARELFEEVGILLARRAGAQFAGPLPAELAVLRRRSEAGEPFARLLAQHELVPATDRLFYFARWITPINNPKRWDTRFLVGLLPDGQEAIVDGTETVSCTWFTPQQALAEYEAGRIILIPPTVHTLDDLARFPSVTEVLADARRRVVRAVTPEVVVQGEFPGLRYPDNTGTTEHVGPRTLILRDGRWRPQDQ